MKLAVLAIVFLSSACFATAQTAPAAPSFAAQAAMASASIRAAMTAQSDAWNRADVDTFMQGYEDSPETTFVGTSVRKGLQPILERYKQNYTTAEQMGKLTFTDLDVRLLPSSCGTPELALVTGKFHLQRTTRGNATKDEGIFSLVWRNGPHGWKIILDHTS